MNCINKKIKKILLTGAAGMLGADVLSCLSARKGQYEIVATDIQEMDFTDLNQVRDMLLSVSPDIVLHLGAYTGVDRAESDNLTCWKVNVEGTKNIAFFCRELNCDLIYISTDYVFDGTANKSYTEEDRPNPINFYGLSKYHGELAIKVLTPRHKIVRTSWLCGPGGTAQNFIETMLRLTEEKKELNIVTDQTGKPTFTFDLAPTLCQLMERAEYGVFHITNDGICTWFDFAREILQVAGKEHLVLKEITTAQLGRPAKRPAFSALENKRLAVMGIPLLPCWKESLATYFEYREKLKKEKTDAVR